MAGSKHQTDEEGRRKVFSLIKDIRVAMMATYAPDGIMHARPMVARLVEDAGEFWFFASRESATIAEIKADPRVLLTYAEPAKQHYVSISGRGAVLDRPAKAKELWAEPMRTWFPKGPEDTDLILIKVDGERAQYWDAPSSTVVYAYGYVKARLTGERPSPGEEVKVRL